MDNSLPYDIPLELIAESFAGNLSENEKLRLRQWLDAAPANTDKYNQLKELWNDGMDDYAIYQLANEYTAWQALEKKLKEKDDRQNETNIINGKFTDKPSKLRYIVAVAAMFLGLVLFWFIYSGNKPVVYETAATSPEKVFLGDGSSVMLSPDSRIEVPRDYNKTNRTLKMTSGEAFFDVKHSSRKPFVVKLGPAQIVDIGTSFTIKKVENKIAVSVTTGKVIFVKLSNSETRELKAGTAVTFDLKKESFGELTTFNPLLKDGALKFDNTSLAGVIVALQQAYGKKIKLGDNRIAHKKLTARLEGMPYNTALEVICKSLGLEYTVADSVYILNEIKTEQP